MADGVDGSELINNYEEEREIEGRRERRGGGGAVSSALCKAIRKVCSGASYDGNANAGKVQGKKNILEKWAKMGKV